METKKGIYQTQQNNSFSQNDESSEVENYLKHAHPQTRPADHLGRSFQLNKSFNEDSNNSVQQVRSDSEYRIVQSCDSFNNVVPSPHYVQYQKPFQNPHYHAHQAALVPNIPHNLVVQNSPQVWIPQQHHYRLPQAQNAEYKNVSISSAQTTPSKQKDSEKKKVSGISQLKSPIAKRPLEAPVTMQGWLHKQGSEGLMLWKKRWFVLSEYCLFYYKGPEEEKLLGSILLPSYKVSLCKPEEKISKKYAFKCEHLNMRTYILAADSQELMKQWVHNLSLAATMQTNVDVHKPSNYNAVAQQQKAVERYEPSCQQQYHKSVMRLTPISHTHSPSSSVLQDQGSFNQPLYANAPPKPRRLNDGFSSPSPDILDPHNPHYVDPRTLDKSPVPTYSTVNYKSKNPRESLMMLGSELHGNHDFERRTPDTYGRSKLNNPHLTDYEDVYAAQPDIYKRPLSPVAYSHVVKRNNPVPINPTHRYYTPVEAMGPTDLVQYSVPQMRRVPNINTARPHSADFLEYELNHKVQDQSVLLKQRPRPKSSLEINSNLNDNDNYFYSKERYAEKMRKSAQYLQNTPPKFRSDLVCNSNEPPMRCSAHDTTFPFIERPHVHTHVPNVNKLHINNIQKPQPVRRKSVLSEGNPFNTSMDMDSRLLMEREPVSPYYLYGNNIRNQDYDSFTRSASARLAQTPTELDRISVDNRSTDREGEKKREESMKRLLEWKQRMLQSPLNRKIQGNVAYRGKTGFYDNNNYDNGYKVRSRNPKRNNVYRDEMLNKSSSQYNSYSSDDEENEKQSEEIIQSQAGETLDTERTTPPISTSTTTLITSTDPAKPKCHPTLSQTDNVFETSSGCSYIPEKPSFQTSTMKFVEKTDSIQSECYQNQDDLFATSDIKNNNETEEQLQEELNEKEDEEKALEENYIPMSPSKNLLSPRTSYNSGSDVFVDKSKVDESPYVEMTQNASACFLDSSLSTDQSEHQPYELISFSGDKIEPLYMELKSPGKKLKREELPDVLVSPQKDVSNKSDSSDADDEASKDLDSLDTPSQPRFSLSDTFRPASYYLGTTQANTELQDSSDSELVSPPPIPSSPPSLEDLNSGEYVKLKVKNEEAADTSSISSFLKHSPSITSVPKTISPVIKVQEMSSKFTDGESDVDSVHRATVINHMRLQSQSSTRSPVHSVENQHLSTDFKDEMSVSSNQLDFHDYENLIISRCDESVTVRQTDKLNDDSYSFSKLELPQVRHQASSTFNSVEMNSFLQNSNRSTPISETISLCTPNAFSSSSAPYYYSDLSISFTDSHLHLLTLNNKRNTMTCHKRDISHIKNPIKGDFREASTVDTFKLAAEARSVSVDFLNLTDKTGHIDDKNIYESDTIQRNKSEQNFAKTRNLLASRKSNKFVASDAISYEAKVRRSHSLEGLLEHVLKDGILASNVSEQAEESNKTQEDASEGSYLWEEDSIWRERLRSASQRHTKSMEDLDCIDEVQKKTKSPRGITRSVTYVNEGFLKMDKQKELENIQVKNSDSKAKQEGNFILDREKLRQWDLMSSAPSDNQAITATNGQVQEGNNVVVDSDVTCDSAEITDDQKTASGSISINMRDSSQLALRDSFLRAMSAKKSWATNSLPMESRSVTNLSRNMEKDQYSTSTPKTYYSHQTSSHPNLTPVGRQDNWRANDRVSVSAGELLGRTHEELVLLLIQLRRQNAQTLQAIENYYNEVDRIQAQLCVMDQARRMENLQKLEQIRQHLLELEKQYEKGKPLVNLVDNMVKLGSLYRTPQEKSMATPQIRDRLEFNQQIQERRLLADQKREWNRLNSNHHQFQEKVQQLYILDRLIHEESGTLQKLQQDKEDIERALGGLRHRLSKGFNDPSEIEIARKQQVILENDLSRVYFMLAQNSKKLEETVSGNAKLEQELMVLKQKLQNSRQGSPQYSNAGDSLTCTIGSNIGVESDLQKVEKKIGELQKQRQKLSLQVRQLTNRSPNASQQKPTSSSFQNSLNKKKIPSLWRETDLDTMSSIDHGECDQMMKVSPMYINTDSKLEDYDYYSHVDSSNTSVSENNSVIPQEKQEIKTVRIVKRESEKRQRDREKLIPGKWDVVQEDDGVNNTHKGLITSNIEHLDKEPNNSTHNLASSSSVCDQEPEKSSDMLPVFKSEAARQIITEMSVQPPLKQPNRRAVPKEKRRHYTAPHNHSIKSLNPQEDVFDKLNVNNRRARDDLDMERALRQRIDAPDVVRSTLINTELKYNERTIDDLLGIPSKINIPERYIPEQLPQLSVEEQEHRMKKVETIKKMLSDTTFISTSSTNLTGENRETKSTPSSSIGNKATTQIMDEKKQREHLLQLNQILAKQVMEMSKIVAGINNSEEQS